MIFFSQLIVVIYMFWRIENYSTFLLDDNSSSKNSINREFQCNSKFSTAWFFYANCVGCPRVISIRSVTHTPRVKFRNIWEIYSIVLFCCRLRNLIIQKEREKLNLAVYFIAVEIESVSFLNSNFSRRLDIFLSDAFWASPIHTLDFLWIVQGFFRTLKCVNIPPHPVITINLVVYRQLTVHEYFHFPTHWRIW